LEQLTQQNHSQPPLGLPEGSRFSKETPFWYFPATSLRQVHRETACPVKTKNPKVFMALGFDWLSD